MERIDADVAGLEAHFETLDMDTLAIDRAEAGVRAGFDHSKSATLARRYESKARRGFFKTLTKFRRVEAEFEAEVESSPAPTPAPPVSAQPEARMGSSREMPAPPDRQPSRSIPDLPNVEAPVVRGSEGRPSGPVRTPGTSR